MKKVRERTLEEILADPDGGHTEQIDVEVDGNQVNQDKIITWLKYAIIGGLVIVVMIVLANYSSVIVSGVAGIGAVILIALLYFLPAVIADRRNHHQRNAILLLNLFFGWSVIGWAVALIWSATAVRKD